MPGQTTVSELSRAMPLKPKGFITFLDRARREILRSHKGPVISRYREDEMLMLYKRSYPELGGPRYDVTAMELVFSDAATVAPQLEDAIWYLTYVGHALSDKKPLSEMSDKKRIKTIRKIESFLSAVLLQNDDPAMFRGPESYEAGDWTYLCTQNGEFTRFDGEETVFYKDDVVYHGTYMGQIRT